MDWMEMHLIQLIFGWRFFFYTRLFSLDVLRPVDSGSQFLHCVEGEEEIFN